MQTQIESPIPAASAVENDLCAERLAGMWIESDIHPAYPATSSTVCELLRDGGGFDCNVELLESWARSKQVGTVPMQSGRFKWLASNILLAAGLCNAARRWLPLHPLHVGKMTSIEVLEQQSRALGQTIFDGLDETDCRTLLGVISNTEDLELRLTLAAALQTKLTLAGLK